MATATDGCYHVNCREHSGQVTGMQGRLVVSSGFLPTRPLHPGAGQRLSMSDPSSASSFHLAQTPTFAPSKFRGGEGLQICNQDVELGSSEPPRRFDATEDLEQQMTNPNHALLRPEGVGHRQRSRKAPEVRKGHGA